MKIFLVGLGCVGKSTTGKLLADRLDYKFYDLDEEIERYFKKPISFLQKEFFGMYGYWAETSIVLDKLLDRDESMVIAGTAASLRVPRLNVYKKHRKRSNNLVSVHIIDYPENIVDRLTFYDDYSVRYNKQLSDKEKNRYLKDIKKDYTYFKISLWRADLQVHIGGVPLQAVPELLEEKIEEYHPGRKDKYSVLGRLWYANKKSE